MENLNCNKKIILVCHCFLNCNSKVENFNEYNKNFEEKKKNLIMNLIKNDIGIIQLPCPEMKIYGCRRWGHVKEQFDTPHFRDMSREMLKPVLNEIRDYSKNGFNIIGILGVNGSPSCGVNLTCSGKWYGEFSHNHNLNDMLASLEMVEESGVFIEEIKGLLEENNLNIPIVGVDISNIDNINEILDI